MTEEQVFLQKDGYNLLEHQANMDVINQALDMNLFNILKPQFGKEGDEWFVLYGGDLQSGICGFGKTLMLAIRNFNGEFHKEANNKQ